MASEKIESSDALLEILREIKPVVFSDFDVKEIELFGSFARDSVTQESDIDLLVTFGEDATLFDLVRLKLFLEEYLGRMVDVVPKESLRVELRESVFKEAIAV